VEYLLQLKNIRKEFDQTVALNSINLNIGKGKIFGLLGPNGAGKSTLIRIITNIIAADSGEIIFDGQQNYLHPLNFGYMPEERGLYKKMKVGEQLLYLTQLKGLKKSTAKQFLNYWIEKFDIGSWLKKSVDDLSKGMQQKIQFITTVAHQPKLIILDEPFSGLDPINTNIIKNEIYELAKNGATIIFSTHRMEQVEEVCEEIALINNGSIILNGRVKDLKEKFYTNEYEIISDKEVYNLQNDIYQVLSKNRNNLLLKLNENYTSKDLLKIMMKLNIDIISYSKVLPSINDIFINLVNKADNEVE